MQAIPDRVAELQALELQLRDLRSRSDLIRLCTQLLNFEPADNQPLRFDNNQYRVGFAEVTVVARAGDFRIIYGRMAADDLSREDERALINALINEHPYSLFVFSDQQCREWHFVNHPLTGGSGSRRLLRRMRIDADDLRMRTVTERLFGIMVSEASRANALLLAECVDTAFDVEKVTAEFFKDYRRIFSGLQAYLNSQVADAEWAHDYALQFLNRVMFVYFIQRRKERWLGEN